MEDKPAAVWEERERGRSGSWAEKAGFLVSPLPTVGPPRVEKRRVGMPTGPLACRRREEA